MTVFRKFLISNVKFILFIALLLQGPVFAQSPAGFDPNNLSNVRIDELSDEQVAQIMKQIQGNGVSYEQAEQLAMQRGLPRSEAAKLRARISGTTAGSKNRSAGVSNPEDSITKSNIRKSDDNAQDVKEEIKKVNPKATVYGHEYFRDGNIKAFDRSADAKAPANYVIGIGDEIGVSVYGYSYYNEVLKVDARGAINPSQMGPIYVKGLTYENATGLIKSKMKQYFDLSNNKLEVTLAYSRSISVNIVGEVLQPGTYKIPALNSAFNALIVAGGPSDLGTLRSIQIKRGGKTVRTIDIYAFLNENLNTQEFFLEDNDFIVVPASKKLVKIAGEVKRPGTYEMLDKEDLTKLISYAAGLTSNAYTGKVQIKRVNPTQTQIIDVNLDSLMALKKDFPLMNGDEILIRNSVTDIINKITVKGAVNFPGEFNFYPGNKVNDIINKAGGLKPESNLDNAYLVRTKQDQTKAYFRLSLKEIQSNPNSEQNLALQALDELTIYSNRDYIDSLTISIFGAVRNEANQEFVNGMTLGDALQNAGGLKLEAENLRIEISRLSYFSTNYKDGEEVRVTVESIKLNDPKSFLNDADAGIVLQPFDQIFVRTVPNFGFQENVTLRGEVKYPGVYTLQSKNEKIADVIRRAGGLTEYAFDQGATYYRPTLQGGFVVFKLKDAMKNDNSKYNYTLKGGDVLTIPTITDYVSIQGSGIEYLSVIDRSQVNAPFVKGKSAKYYINEFGNGFTKEAWKKKTYVLQPNAKINRTKSFLGIKKYPKVTKGSTIYVVEKVKKEEQIKKEQEPFDWNKFIENTTIKLTGLATLIILFRQL
jgi:protein involved in polysaccharide export with SLBB domain